LKLGALLVPLLVAFFSFAVRANPNALDVALDIAPCADVSRTEVERRLALELGARVLGENETSKESCRARVSCEENGHVLLRIDDPLTQKSLSRSLDLKNQNPAVRARVLAVAITELLHASFTELLLDKRADKAPRNQTEPSTQTATPKQTVSLPPPPATPLRTATHKDPPTPPWDLSLGVLGSVLLQRDEPWLFLGGGVGFVADHAHHVGLGLEAQTLVSQVVLAQGNVRSDLVGARISLHGHARASGFVLRGGGGLRLGVVRHAGQPISDEKASSLALWGPWLSPGLYASATAEIGRLRMDFSIEGSYALIPVLGRVDGEVRAQLTGPQLLLSVGLGTKLR